MSFPNIIGTVMGPVLFMYSPEDCLKDDCTSEGSVSQ